MIRVDYTTLAQPALRLTLHRSAGGYYSVTDQNGRLFTPPTENLTFCLKFMAAMAQKGDAVLDEPSFAAFGRSVRGPSAFSVRVPPSSGEACGPADGNGPVSPDSTRHLRMVL